MELLILRQLLNRYLQKVVNYLAIFNNIFDINQKSKIKKFLILLCRMIIVLSR
jgi:hypothetical protein